jgi:DNA-binding PadR family transcriptional regulator
VTKNGRRARYYHVTHAGRDYLREESARLVDHFDGIVAIFRAKTAT